MTKDRKLQSQCSICGTYFHNKDRCPFKVSLYYNCYSFGHRSKDCKRGKSQTILDFNIKLLTIVNFNRKLLTNVPDHQRTSVHDLERLFSKEILILLDSGATHHAVSTEQILFDFVQFQTLIVVITATENSTSLALGKGILLALLSFGRTKCILSIKNVYYVPDLTDADNPLSIRMFNTSSAVSAYMHKLKLRI